MKTYISRDRDNTLALGRLIGSHAPGGSVIAFRGGLGVGKTTLSKGIAQGLGIKEEVNSPTFTIISEYSGRLLLRHIDVYRLRSEADFEEIGGLELLGAPDSLCLIEWSEKLPGLVDENTAIIEIEYLPDGARKFHLSGDWLEALPL